MGKTVCVDLILIDFVSMGDRSTQSLRAEKRCIEPAAESFPAGWPEGAAGMPWRSSGHLSGQCLSCRRFAAVGVCGSTERGVLTGCFPAISNMLNAHHRDILFLIEKRTPQMQRLNNAGNFQAERLDRQPAVVT